MKVMSFSGSDETYLKYVLPALLKGVETDWKEGKNQTVRPAWMTNTGDLSSQQIEIMNSLKQPRFKVGETIRLEWKSRNSPKGSVFHTKDGSIVKSMIHVGTYENFPGWKELYFTKILSVVKITEVFKIEIGKDADTEVGIFFEGFTGKESEELAKRDGFPDAETMFKWFDRYGLEQPKPFHVYQWEGM